MLTVLGVEVYASLEAAPLLRLSWDGVMINTFVAEGERQNVPGKHCSFLINKMTNLTG